MPIGIGILSLANNWSLKVSIKQLHTSEVVFIFMNVCEVENKKAPHGEAQRFLIWVICRKSIGHHLILMVKYFHVWLYESSLIRAFITKQY